MALVGGCRSLELRCTCDLLRAYLPMTRNTSATSIKHDHLLRWGGQMYYPEKACNDNYVRRRETPSLGGASAPESSSRDDRHTMGELPGNYESRLVISACSGVSLVPSAWFRYSTLERAKAIIHSRWRASNRSLQRESAPRNTLSRTQSLPDGRALTQGREAWLGPDWIRAPGWAPRLNRLGAGSTFVKRTPCLS